MAYPFIQKYKVPRLVKGSKSSSVKMAKAVADAYIKANPYAQSNRRFYLPFQSGHVSKTTPIPPPRHRPPTYTKFSTGTREKINGNGGLCDKVVRTLHPVRPALAKIYKQGESVHFNNNVAGRITSSIGQQGVNLIQTIYTPAILNQIQYYGFNSTAGITNGNTQTMYVRDCETNIQITNQDVANVTFSLYEIQPRRDTTTSSASPITTWSDGLTDEQAGQFGTIGNLMINTTPFQSKKFCTYFKVKSVKKITLASGQQYLYKHILNVNKKWNMELYTGGIQGLSHETTMFMIVQQGSVENDSTTKTQVSVGPSALDYVCDLKYQVYGFNDSQTRYIFANALPSAFTVGGEIINEKTGAVVADDEAHRG